MLFIGFGVLAVWLTGNGAGDTTDVVVSESAAQVVEVEPVVGAAGDTRN